jgi:hypothetical protein
LSGLTPPSGCFSFIRLRPDSDGCYGRLQAIDLQTRETVWTVSRRAPQLHFDFSSSS